MLAVRNLAGSNMATGETMDDSPLDCPAAPAAGAREALLIVMLMYGLAQGGESFAADQASNVVKEIQPLVGGKPLPMAFMPNSTASDAEPSANFQRRRPELDFSAPVERASALQAQPLQTVPSWQHFADYRAQGRVQVLTLWQSTRSTLSLQAGRHGGPSLQWSSRVTNRGPATRGLLDRFVSLGAASLASRTAHGFATTPAAKAIGATPTVK
jgi:hypothetical protein